MHVKVIMGNNIIVVLFELYTGELFAGKINIDLPLQLENANKFMKVLNACIFDSEVVDNKRERRLVDHILEMAREAGILVIAVFAETIDETSAGYSS